MRNEENVAQEIFSPCAGAALYRRSALLEVSGFDEDFFCYVEDVDLGFRLQLAGHNSMYVPSAVVYHMGSASAGGQHSDFSVYHAHRNLVWTYVKNMPGPLLWIFLPLHILLNLLTIVRFTAREQTRVVLKAKWDAILGIPTMWRKRRSIQSSRVISSAQLLRTMDKRLLAFTRQA